MMVTVYHVEERLRGKWREIGLANNCRDANAIFRRRRESYRRKGWGNVKGMRIRRGRQRCS